MSNKKLPGLYTMLGEKHPKFISAFEELGKVVKQEGPLDEKTVHLVQLAGAAAIGSEGAVHSHARRAVKAWVGAGTLHCTACESRIDVDTRVVTDNVAQVAVDMWHFFEVSKAEYR